MTQDPRFRVPLMLVTSLLVHTVLTSQLRVFGAAPDILMLLPIAGALVGGRVRGAAYGFAVGFSIDVFLILPFGVSALVYCLVGYGVGVVRGGLLALPPAFNVLAAFGASAGGVVLYALVDSMLGQPLVAGRLPAVIVVVGGLNAVLTPIAVRWVRWSMAGADRAAALR